MRADTSFRNRESAHVAVSLTIALIVAILLTLIVL